MITAPIQIWIGFFLIVSGISFGRMGPSFKRNRYTLFFVLLGTLCILLPKSNLYDQSSLNQLPEYYLMNIIVLSSLYLYVEYNSHFSVKEIFLAFSSFIGILISLLCFAILVRYIENSTPLDEPAPELTDEEKELVTRIISKNIGVDEG